MERLSTWQSRKSSRGPSASDVLRNSEGSVSSHVTDSTSTKESVEQVNTNTSEDNTLSTLAMNFERATSFMFSPDDKYLFYLYNPVVTSMNRDLFYFDMSLVHEYIDQQNSGNDGNNGDGQISTEMLLPLCHNQNPISVIKSDILHGDTEENLSLEEKLRRERKRNYSVGVTSYSLSAQRILIPLQNCLYIQDGVEAPLIKVFDGTLYGGSGAIDPQLSPDGSKLAFVKDNELHLIYLESVGETLIEDDLAMDLNENSKKKILYQPIRLTSGFRKSTTENISVNETSSNMLRSDNEDHTIPFDEAKLPPPKYIDSSGNDGRSNGLADFIAQEEMDRYNGFWWSPDSTKIAFANVDESHIPLLSIVNHSSDEQESHRYPFSGQENPKVLIGILDIQSYVNIDDRQPSFDNNTDESDDLIPSNSILNHETLFEPIWIDMFNLPNQQAYYDIRDYYIARVNWLGNRTLGIQVENRQQNALTFLKGDAETGEVSVLLTEVSPYWINLNDLFHLLTKPIVTSEIQEDIGACTEEQKEEAFSFLWGSERSGFMHLYLYTFIKDKLFLVNNTTQSPYENNEWIVESIAGVNEEENLIFLTGTYDSPLENHLYCLPLYTPTGENSIHPDYNVMRLTSFPGIHKVKMDRRCTCFVDTYSNPSTPKTSVLFLLPSISELKKNLFDSNHFNKATSSNIHEIDIRNVNYKSPLRSVVMESLLLKNITGQVNAEILLSKDLLVSPHYFTFYPSRNVINPCTTSVKHPFLGKVEDKHVIQTKLSNRDKLDILYGCAYFPSTEKYGNGPYPTVVSVYGGPCVQRVNLSWTMTADMMAQKLCDLGFLVVKCDNRGTAGRGLNFESKISWNMGELEVFDQEDCVKYLWQLGLVDIERVGIYGWSYGGYLSSMCLCKAPTVFKAAIAGAPVTTWDGYDTHYTERYMSQPDLNMPGYVSSSVLNHVNKIQGSLMLVHGEMDENVHFRHTARLIKAMTLAQKNYDLVLFPDGRHSLRKKEDRIYLEFRMINFFKEKLSVYFERDEKSTTKTESNIGLRVPSSDGFIDNINFASSSTEVDNNRNIIDIERSANISLQVNSKM